MAKTSTMCIIREHEIDYVKNRVKANLKSANK